MRRHGGSSAGSADSGCEKFRGSSGTDSGTGFVSGNLKSAGRVRVGDLTGSGISRRRSGLCVGVCGFRKSKFDGLLD